MFHPMIGIANALDKPVFLTPELGSATDDELRRNNLCVPHQTQPFRAGSPHRFGLDSVVHG